MTQAREAILRAAGGVESAAAAKHTDAAAIAVEARKLLAAPDERRPALPSMDVVEAFIARVCGPKVGATAERIPSFAALPAAVARYLAAKGLGVHVAVQPTGALQSLAWAEAGLTPDGTLDEGVAVGLARLGIAETGSLVFHSAADTPILFNFLPAVHIVVVRAGSIVPHLEDYTEAARMAADGVPRNACLITGASGTTDIEGDLVRGAHGPRELHIIVAGDAV